jgi:hypothetical protein
MVSKYSDTELRIKCRIQQDLDQEKHMFAGKWARPVLFCAVLLGGCAGHGFERMEPGSISIDQVRAKEKPAAEWKNADGTLTLEYDDRPYTGQNLMMDFDESGRLLASRPVITPENLARLKRGMRREDFKRILGNPRYTWRDGNGGEVWEWPLDPPLGNGDGSAKWVIEVHFHPTVDGAVSVERGSRAR